MNPDEFAQQRHEMVEKQLRRRGITDARVLAAFERVPRHRFVSPENQEWAYRDSPLEIGFGQTISQPYIVAYMTQLLKLIGTEQILEVGCGSGYQAAILSCLAAQVYSVEIIPELAKRAATTLAELGLSNVHVEQGDGSQGWSEAAPYDAILVAAAAPRVPPALLSQLSPNGRLILPVGPHGAQNLEFWQRTETGFECQAVLAVMFVLLRGQDGWPGSH